MLDAIKNVSFAKKKPERMCYVKRSVRNKIKIILTKRSIRNESIGIQEKRKDFSHSQNKLMKRCNKKN